MSFLRIGAVLGAILVLPACVPADGPYYGYVAPHHSYAVPVYRAPVHHAPVRHWGHHGGWGGHRGWGHGGWGHGGAAHRGWGGHGGHWRGAGWQQPVQQPHPRHAGWQARPQHHGVNPCRVLVC